MSFPKAKLCRFNEEMTCAPPPGKYDPRFDSKIKGAVIEKSKRFVETPKLQPSPCSDSASSCSHSNKPTFRTPQLPRKKMATTPRSAFEIGKTSIRTPSSVSKTRKRLDDDFKFASEKYLIEQIDELTRVHSSQLIEKDQELSTLYNEISTLKSNLVKFENSREIDYNNIKHKYDAEMSKIKTELEEAHISFENEKLKHEEIVRELKNKVKMLEENLKNCNSLNSEMEFQMSQAQLSLIEMKNNYAGLEEELISTKLIMEKIVEDKESEIKSIKESYKQEFENGKKNWIEDNENMFKNAELMMLEISEKVKQFDSQASEVFSAVKNLSEKFDNQYTDLLGSLNLCSSINNDILKGINIEDIESQKATDLEQKIEISDLSEKISTLDNEVKELKKQCKKYEIVRAEASKTIQVLSTRLFESESEVENMNECKEELILRKNALEGEITALRNENEELKEKMKYQEVNIIKDVIEFERNIISEVETFQKTTCQHINNETTMLKAELVEKQKSVEYLLSELDAYKHKVSELNEHKLFYEEISNKCKEEIESLSYKFKDIENRYNNNMSTQKSQYEKLSCEFEEFKHTKKEEHNELNREKTILDKECQEKVFELNNLKLEINQLKEKLSKAENDIALMEEASFEREKHMEELSIQLDHYTDCGIKSANQINVLTKQLEEREEELNKKDEESAEKDQHIEAISADLEQSKSYVQTMTEHVVALMGELAEKGKEIENLVHDIEMKNATMIQVSEEYEKMKQLYEEEIKKAEIIEKELHDTQCDNEKYVDEIISELVLEKERCTELNLVCEEASSNLKDAQDKIKMLEEKIESNEKEYKEKIETLKNTIDDNNQQLVRVNQLNEGINSYKEQIKHLEEKLENKNTEFEKQIENLKINENLLNDEIFRLNNVKNALEKKYKEKDSRYKEMVQANTTLTSQLGEVTTEKDDLAEIVKRQWEEMDMLTNEISNQQEEIDELKQMKEDKCEEIRAVYQTELQNQVFALQQSLEDTQKVVIQLKSKEEDLVFKLRSAEADLTQAETDKETYDATLSELNGKITDLENKLYAMEKRKNEYKMFAMEVENENTAVKEEIEKLNFEKEKLQEEQHEESMSMASLNARIADLECRNRDLESIIGPFKEQLMQFESERELLLSKSENTEKELKALALEHAKALGHQNHRQKIRHVVHLTETISDLKKEFENGVSNRHKNKANLFGLLKRLLKLLKPNSDIYDLIGEMEKLRVENNKLRATVLEHQESSFKKGGVRGKKDKENPIEATSPLVKNKTERQIGSGSPLKPRNVT